MEKEEASYPFLQVGYQFMNASLKEGNLNAAVPFMPKIRVLLVCFQVPSSITELSLEETYVSQKIKA